MKCAGCGRPHMACETCGADEFSNAACLACLRWAQKLEPTELVASLIDAAERSIFAVFDITTYEETV